MQVTNKAFKAYDVRGVYPTEVNEEMAYRMGRIFSAMFAAETVVVGHDIRLSGRALVDALTEGLRHGGTKVIDIGQCGTEMIYFATAHLKADGGIMVTASHNPKEYNGMKLVRRDARPVSSDTGLKEIGEMVATSKEFVHKVVTGKTMGAVEHMDIMPAYIEHLLTYVDTSVLKPMKIVANPGNGGAGPILKELAKHLPFEFITLNETPDGTFPNGVPNPLLLPNREATAKVVRESGADLGIAWDGDFDRCFLFDEKADFIEGYYIVGLLAEVFLHKEPGAKIMFDPRLTWNTEAILQRDGGVPVRCKSGHAFMKECMRNNDVLYGGEMSAHHYFRDFSFEVGEATVTGNSAQVSVNVTCRPVRDIVTQLVEKCAGKWEAAAPTLWELLDGSEPQQVQISVSCTKESDGTWSCDDGLKRALTDLCLK